MGYPIENLFCVFVFMQWQNGLFWDWIEHAYFRCQNPFWPCKFYSLTYMTLVVFFFSLAITCNFSHLVTYFVDDFDKIFLIDY